jgi:hypothetical protein
MTAFNIDRFTTSGAPASVSHHRRGRVGDDWTAILYDTGTFKAPWIP